MVAAERPSPAFLNASDLSGLELFRESVGVAGLLPRQFEPRADRVDHRLASRRAPWSWPEG
jgi:hypothetical protein